MNYRWLFYNTFILGKNYLHFPKKRCPGSISLVVVDKWKKRPGFVDLLKGIVGCYYVSKLNDFDFKLKFTYPFYLDKYLVPNIVKWNDYSKISNSLLQIKLSNYDAYQERKFKKEKQYHIYNFVGLNILEKQNVENWEDSWSKLYKELFRPSRLLEKRICELPFVENSYISVHIRFLNSLEQNEPDYPLSALTDNERETLINKCFKSIERVKGLSSCNNVIVFSDSNTFLKKAKEKGYMVLDGIVGHTSINNSEDIVLKMFIDLYAISRSSSAYGIVGTSLYNSVFPRYASLIGSKQFKRIDYEKII